MMSWLRGQTMRSRHVHRYLLGGRAKARRASERCGVWSGEGLVEPVLGLVDLVELGEDFATVVLISGAHPEVRRRGRAYRDAISGLFVSALGPDGGDAVRERQFCFSLVFSAMVLRTAYGTGYGPDGDVDDLTRTW